MNQLQTLLPQALTQSHGASIISAIRPQALLLRRWPLSQMLLKRLFHHLLDLIASTAGNATRQERYNARDNSSNGADKRNHASRQRSNVSATIFIVVVIAALGRHGR